LDARYFIAISSNCASAAVRRAQALADRVYQILDARTAAIAAKVVYVLPSGVTETEPSILIERPARRLSLRYAMDIKPSEVRVNPAKNRLYLFLRGFWSEEMAAAVSARVKREAKALKPGFSIINDISQLKIGPPEAAAIVKECQEWLGAQGAGRVVRVVSADNPLAKMQFKRTSQEAYDASVATTVREAEQMLDG